METFNVNASEKKFYEELETQVKLVQLLDTNLLNDALELVPYEELNNKVSEKQLLLGNTSKTDSSEVLLILELLHWFKSSFFSWVDAPKCNSCNQSTSHKGMVPPTPTELEWGALRVEQYFCNSCQRSIRFPRYNHPRKLLQTRKGRCGEWANCFNLLCQAIGYESRLVFDWSDHVWTEVFSHTENRWLHCDPCEAICDKPLIYEMGWKKDISYVIAFSKYEVQDVTWRYTANFLEVLSRRKLCREMWLIARILSLSDILQSTLSNERKEELKRRRVLELVEFLTPPKITADDFGGRLSGSLAWRLARGETSTEVENPSFIFNLSKTEVENKYFHIKYNCALDKYIRVSDKSIEKLNWETCTFKHSDVFRKTETDWNMVYIARREGSTKGTITWKFDFKTSGLVIQNLKLNICCKTYENGIVRWLFSSSNGNVKEYKPEDLVFLSCEDFKGASELTITAELTGGIGQVAWQHSQLFRQQLCSQEFPFELQISFNIA